MNTIYYTKDDEMRYITVEIRVPQIARELRRHGHCDITGLGRLIIKDEKLELIPSDSFSGELRDKEEELDCEEEG